MIDREDGGGFESAARRIAELKEELGRVEGTPTEVYSRIVGYYRSVRNWNAGKRDEYLQRVSFRMPGSRDAAKTAAALGDAADGASASMAAGSGESEGEMRESAIRAESSRPNPAAAVGGRPAAAPEPYGAELRNGVLVFTREACPNCSPVANYVMGAGLEAVFIDVDREEGLELARSYGVMATPTVLGIDSEGRERYRAFGVGELRERIERASAPRPC